MRTVSGSRSLQAINDSLGYLIGDRLLQYLPLHLGVGISPRIPCVGWVATSS
jgi:hypothetical protein